MIVIRKSEERGYFEYEWLKTSHTFSFGNYYDPAHMGFQALRVINEDIISPGQGFPMHGHKHMEILSYVVNGALAHKDSAGNEGIITGGMFQFMSAGSGVRHSEFNASKDRPVHLLQIWIVPSAATLSPRYGQLEIADEASRNKLAMAVSSNEQDGVITIGQDTKIFVSTLEAGVTVNYRLKQDRHAWLQVIKGTLELNGAPVQTGDGAAISAESDLSLHARSADSEFLLFDLADFQ